MISRENEKIRSFISEVLDTVFIQIKRINGEVIFIAAV